MVQRLLCRVAVTRVHLEEHADQVLGVLRDVLPVRRVEGKVAEPDLRQDVGVRLAVEGRVTAEHDVHDDTATPEVAHVVVLAREHLRCHVVGCPRFGGEDLAALKLAGEAEVDDLELALIDVFLGGEEEVLGLQIAVADVKLVHVEDGPDYLLHDRRCLALVEVADFDDAVEQLASNAQLKDQVDVPLVLEGLVQLDDVWVIHLLHDADLLLESLDVLHVGLGNALDRPDCLGGLRRGLDDGTVGPLAQLLLLHVVEFRYLAFVVGDERRVRDAALLDWPLRNILLVLPPPATTIILRGVSLSAAAAHGS
mmetsp:Transcript_53085/g.158203  ORF Transcript_53085/g.158203 Transcript_53085/m.158203 type:complete len:310 (+) Transcript_53085:675-1604(+)